MEMEKRHTLPQWARRLPQEKIRRLYENDAKGIYDEELIDEVGFALLARCQSFIRAVQSTTGKATCPHCGKIIEHTLKSKDVLSCEACNWELTWNEYFNTIQHKQLSGADPVLKIFQEYSDAFSKVQTYPQKVFLIDQLIHGFHRYLTSQRPTRPVAVNLIEGRLGEVIALLDSLSYSERSTPGTKENQGKWNREVLNARRWSKP